MGATLQPVVRSTGKRRYRRSDETRRIVEETLAPGASVAVIARRPRVTPTWYFTGASCIRQDFWELPRNDSNLPHRERNRMARLLLKDVILQKRKGLLLRYGSAE